MWIVYDSLRRCALDVNPSQHFGRKYRWERNVVSVPEYAVLAQLVRATVFQTVGQGSESPIPLTSQTCFKFDAVAKSDLAKIYI